MLARAAQRRADSDPAEWRRLRCSFCGRRADDVRFLAAGVAGGMICDGCNFKSLAIFVKAHLAAALRIGRS